MDAEHMNGVDADREDIEERRVLVGDVIGQQVDILGRRFRVFAEAAAPANADMLQRRAEVIVAGEADGAPAALQQWLDSDSVPDIDLRHVGRDLDDVAAELVAQHLAQDAGGELRNAVLVEMDVAAANTGDLIADQHFTGAEREIGHVPHLEGAWGNEDRGTHLLSSRIDSH
jgi:hypothetical protein